MKKFIKESRSVARSYDAGWISATDALVEVMYLVDDLEERGWKSEREKVKRHSNV